ncbi:MAG: YtxH domain-containing protein [Gemmatimonadota bacterium]|nr:YtxH domain-containing protein [Gemmatimonadota bacterium]
MFTSGLDDSGRKPALTPLTEEPVPEMVPDWTNIGVFATGIALGALLGATVALLVAPESGSELRGRVARKFGRGGDDESVWDELAGELARAKADLARAIETKRED